MLNSKSIGNKIAAARKKCNLSQAELAQQVFLSPQAVGKWERGESMPDITTLNRLAEILRVDLNYFSEVVQQDELEAPAFERLNHQKEESPISEQAKRHEWNWDMSQGDWADADFSGLKNLKEKFSSSNIKNCKFINADLSGLILSNNNIELCDFTGSDIRNSKMQQSNLLKTQFHTCSFIDAKLFKNNIEKCDFTEADFSGAEVLEVNFEWNVVKDCVWNFTMFKKTNINNVIFSGNFQDCHFEHCGFYNVRFENATIRNTFFKYNEKFKKVQFINCSVDKLTYAFLKSNDATLTGITIVE